MPAESQAQRAYLNSHFGHAWVKKHGFDNKGKLPEHVAKSRARTKAAAKRRTRKHRPSGY
jgi:N-acetylglutamate synthase-like GNAT family acetyltransferase